MTMFLSGLLQGPPDWHHLNGSSADSWTKAVIANIARISRFPDFADRAKMEQRPAHPHSIVSGTYKYMNVREFF
jgi:hypothetical protein